MTRFIDIRGGFGVGKSTLLADAMLGGTFQSGLTIRDGVGVAIGHYLHVNGRLYKNRFTVEEYLSLLRLAARKADVVLMEGGSRGRTLGKVYDWLRTQSDYRVLYLAPPSQIWRRQLEKRRGRKLTARALTVAKDDHAHIADTIYKMKEDGVHVETTATREDAIRILTRWIKGTT